MAACTAASTCVAAAGLPTLKVAASSAGLRTSTSVHMLGARKPSTALQSVKSRARTTCADTSVVVSISTGALLFLGRFVFLPFQRAQVAKAGLPVQNGVTHYEAGDGRAQEVVSLLKTNDPAGFTIVDVLAWGALGHAVAYIFLATASNGYDPQF